ncbi:AGAP007168-PA-like protein [Anopheles sinensis]|uniref:dolichyl-P-Man:Man5GlcNAc2-PP-dolichol alpha-1,3-mannosyltransferase n=1 Tax=Anopheles sinensis TaxID=74873 RepID=A0A084VQZ4_ANOSI|nr:AGAP007168-PA-like protein [Anopheles sinensis]
MAPPGQQANRGKNVSANRKESQNLLAKIRKEYVNITFAKSLIFDPARLPFISVLILAAELVLNVFIVQNVRYTEIDWKAYMQECEGFLNGTTDYSQLRGDTGPLVYPAGFVYIYSALYFLTSRGTNIRLAQYIFTGIYLLQLALVMRLYCKSRKIPPYVMLITIFTSYRIHSIYVLRLFNDPIAILFLYTALNAFIDGRWTLVSVMLSLGVSVKMNILLFAPAILLLFITNLGWMKTLLQLTVCGVIQLVLGAPFLLTYPWQYLKGSFDLGRVFEHKWTMNILLFAPAILLLFITNLGWMKTLLQLTVCGVIQLVLGAPFLLTYPWQYLKGSFDLGRVFEHKWTVNYRFLEPAIFESKTFHLALLALHLTLLAVFASPCYKYFQNYCRLRHLELMLAPQIAAQNRAEKEKQVKKAKKQNKALPAAATGQNGKDEEVLTADQEKFLKSFEKGIKKMGDKKQNVKNVPVEAEQADATTAPNNLHYQFYVWYFHSLPYLTWYTEYTNSLKFLLLLLLEFCWNTYPSTVLSSLLLHTCHVVLLFGIGKKMFRRIPDLAQLNKTD